MVSDKVPCNNGKECGYIVGCHVDGALIPLFIKTPKNISSSGASQSDKNSAYTMSFNVSFPSKLLGKHKFSGHIESFFVESNFRKVKWLLFGTYHTPSQNDIYHFNQLDKAIDTYNNYDKILLIGDFNAEKSEPCLESFSYEHDLQNLVKKHMFQKR